MLSGLFTASSPYRNAARVAAISWTLLLLVLCFIPGNEIPDLKVPFIDKWVHFVLFGIFSFLWLSAFPGIGLPRLLLVLAAAILLGWLVELLQGQLKFLGRNQDNMDTLADSIGGLLGVLLFAFLWKRSSGKMKHTEL